MRSVIDNGSLAVANLARRLDTLSDRAQELEVQNRTLEEQVVHLADYDELRDEHARLGAQMDAWIAHAAEQKLQIEQLRSELEAATARADELGTAAETLRAGAEATQRQYDALRSSRSYRLTEPLRRLRAAFGGDKG
jgi:chromosome segregation ATPase